ncbi:inactive receptor kinase [Spatholobus suberectus]|nr:inactive receptor kinase [Spatholobus suberectus]
MLCCGCGLAGAQADLASEQAALLALRSTVGASHPHSPFQQAQPDLVQLNMGFNNFLGLFLSTFNNLTRLKNVFLENNQLSCPIPEMDKLSLY